MDKLKQLDIMDSECDGCMYMMISVGKPYPSTAWCKNGGCNNLEGYEKGDGGFITFADMENE